MVFLIVHAVAGVAVVVAIVLANRQAFLRPVAGPKVSVLEGVYYIAGVVSVILGWFFNIRFVGEYGRGILHNPIWGPGSWTEFILLGYDNPAAASASQDYTIMSVVLFPPYVIVDGRRRGIRRAWMYLLLILTTSSAFAWAFYLATAERQRRAVGAAPSAAPMPA